MDQIQPFVNTPPVNTGDAPVEAARIPAGMTAAQRLEQLKADPAYMRRWASGDKSADAEMLALTRNAGRQPAAAAPAPPVVDPATAAKERLAQLKYDPEWMAGFQKHGINGPQGREFDALTRAAMGVAQPAAKPEPTESDRAIAGLGAPADISGYNLDNIRGPDGYVRLDDATRTLATTELLPEAHALDLSPTDVTMIASNVANPVTWEQCDESLHRLFGADFEAGMNDFRLAMAANPKARALLERYPETLGNSPMLISSVVAAYRRKGVR